MDRLSLTTKKRQIFGKKVKNLRKEGIIPAHVFGKKKKTEHVSVLLKNFWPVYQQAGETGLIDLKIGDGEILPVMIRGVQKDPVKGGLLHIDFYAVNLSEKVKVPVPVVVVGGEDIDSVKIGDAVILQTLTELEVEALPGDLIENIEVNIAHLKNIDDAVTVGQLELDRSKLTINVDPEEVAVKLAPAITEEMKKLMEEQAAEQAAAAQVAAEEGAEVKAEGGEGETEGAEGEQAATEEGAPKEEAKGEKQE